MDFIVFSIVLWAAALHAGWNFLVKIAPNKQLAITAVVLGHVPAALVCLTFVPAPHPASWPYILVGALLHVGYQQFLAYAYGLGDFSKVYPIARGAAPLFIVAMSVFILGQDIGLNGIFATAVIALGVGGLSFAGRRHMAARSGAAVMAALITGLFIAGYSLVDGLGARLAGTALGFYGWLAVLNALAMALLMLGKNRGALARVPSEGKLAFFVGGTTSFSAFAMVIWAFTQAPIALVSALRETSIIFGLIAGRWLLREHIGKAQLASVSVIALGATLVRLS